MKINNKSMQIFAVFASLMMLTVIAMPVVAAQNDVEYNYCDETQGSTADITLYDLAGSEIEIINGLPYIIVEAEDGYINIPLPLNTMNMIMMVDGVPITVEVDGNYLLIPTEDGIERVCISEFDVELIDENGNLILVHEMNPIKILILKVGISVVVSMIYKRMLEIWTGRKICFWRCGVAITAAGASATLLWSKIMSKLGVEFVRHKTLDAVASSLLGTLQVGILARSIAMTALVIGNCNNRNCLFYPNTVRMFR